MRRYHLGKLPSVAGIIQDVPGVLGSLDAGVLTITPAHATRAGALE